MHDIVFSKEIIRAIDEKSAGISNGARVRLVHVLLSPLSHVTPKSLSDAFLQMTRGTELEGIALDVKPLPLKMACAGCGRIFTVNRPTFSCALCGSSDIRIDDSREFIVESLEAENR